MSARASLRTPFRPVLRRDPHADLVEALGRLLPGGTLLASRQTLWASTTFTGARHEFGYALPEAARASAAMLERTIGDVEFGLAGHFVAEIEAELTHGENRLEIEALTVEE